MPAAGSGSSSRAHAADSDDDDNENDAQELPTSSVLPISHEIVLNEHSKVYIEGLI